MCKLSKLKFLTRKKIISTLSVLIMILLIMSGVNDFSNFLNNQANFNKNIDTINEESKKYIYTLIYNAQDKNKILLENQALNLQNIILDEYSDNTLLENDIKNPTDNSKLSKIFDKELHNKNIIVGSMDKILWNRTYGEYSMDLKDDYTLEDVIYKTYNEELSKEAIDTILKLNLQKNDFIIWQSGKSNIKISNNDINELLNELQKYNYDINELKGYDILIPVYITEDGDILGVKDVDRIGRYNDNCKMVLVQKLNLYDILSHNKYNIENCKDEVIRIQDMIQQLTNDEIVKNIYLLLIIIGIVISSGVIQNRIKE